MVGLIIAAIVIVIATGVIIHKLNKDYQSYVDNYKSAEHRHNLEGMRKSKNVIIIAMLCLVVIVLYMFYKISLVI